MKILTTSASVCILIALLAACGSDETTVIHEKPVVIQTAPGAYVTPADVERHCPHGYDNRTRSCY